MDLRMTCTCFLLFALGSGFFSIYKYPDFKSNNIYRALWIT
jgi:hypothetical protein